MTGDAGHLGGAAVDGATRPVSSALLAGALDASSEAVLLCTARDHRVLLVNAACRSLVPGMVAGQSAADCPVPALAGATRSGALSFDGRHAGRHLTGRRRDLDLEHYAWYLRDETEESDRAAELTAERDRNAFLDKAGRRLAATLNQDRCLRTTTELAVAHLADAAVVVLPPRGRRFRGVQLGPDGAYRTLTMVDAQIAQVPALVEALAGFPPIPSRGLDPAQAPAWLLPEHFGEVGALLVTPLPGNAVPAGALILARRGRGAFFSDADEMLTRVFAARAGGAISTAGLYRDQVETAAILQADLLPPQLPDIPGVELVGAFQPAQDAVRVGGDFYDAFPPAVPDGETVVVLGDVCGKGAEAAVLTGKVRQTLRALRLVERRPEAMLDVLNRALLPATTHRFVTLVVGTVNRTDHGRVRMTLAAGGHPAPLVLRADGTVEQVATRGTLIGAVPHTVVQPATIELAAGEMCLMFSDGLTEARGGASGDEMYGERRLRAALSGCLGMPATATVERLRQLVSDWVRDGQHDDIAMLAVRAPARASLSLAGTDGGHGRQHSVDTRRPPGRPRHR